MRVNELVQKLKSLADAGNTLYMWGMWGQPLTKSVIDQKVKQYPTWYTDDKVKLATANIGKKFGFDCCFTIKAILWGFTGDMNHKNGGATYQTNGVTDMNADKFFSKCLCKSSDFSKIRVGCAVHMDGHIGVYVGDGLVVECTPRWKNGVQYTSLGNAKKPVAGNRRTWEEWGFIPYIDYEVEVQETTESDIKVGDKVTIINTTTQGRRVLGETYDGGSFRVWYSKYEVYRISGDKVTIGVSGVITCNINIEDIRRVEE